MNSEYGEREKCTTRETEAWYKEFVDHAGDLIQCVDSEGRFIYVNKLWLSTLNYTAEEIDIITLWDVIDPGSLEHCKAVFEKVLDGKAYGEVEAVFVTKEGAPVYVEGNVSVKLDDNGRFVHTRGIFRDVTARKKVETALLMVEAEREALLSAIPEFMFLFNRKGQFVDYKAGNHEELLLKPEIFMEKHVSESLPPDLAALTLDYLARLFESGKIQQYEYPLEVNGEQKIFESRLVPCGEDQALAIVRDITERRQVEDALLAERAFQAVLLELATDFINVSPLEFDGAINDMLCKIGEFTGLDRVYLFMHDHLRRVTSNTHEWCRRGISPEIENLQEVPFDFFSDMLETWEKDEFVHIPSVVQMPEEHAMRSILLEQDIQSLVMIPLMEDRVNIGFVGLDAVNKCKSFSEQEIALLRVLAEIISNAFARKAFEEVLQQKSVQLRMILDTVPSYIFAKDIDGHFLLANKAVADVFGVNPEHVEGKTDLDYGATAEQMYTYNKIDRGVIERGESLLIPEEQIMRKDGNPGWFQTVKIPYNHPGCSKPAILGVATDITERKKYEAKLEYLSYHDQLTGLFNRHYQEKEMKSLDTKKQLPISIIIVDLNGLKLVNDTYGYQTGDEMLKRSAAILKSVCRADDLIARFGGDEFLICLPRTPEKEAIKICSRIEKSCRKELIKDVPLSLSTGFAVKISADQDIADLLREAENNMNRDKLTESRSGKSAIVNSFLHTLAAKSFETEAHTRNMQQSAKSIGEKLGLPHSELHRLQLLITLHDIGKINIPEELLTKKSSLTDSEWEIMKKHSETGYRIAKATENFAHVADDILAHHERWDGSGYPQGLKGEAIPLLARITAIADAYEVMSNGRPYKKAMSISDIVAEFKNCSGTQFDPQLVELFLKEIEEESEENGR